MISRIILTIGLCMLTFLLMYILSIVVLKHMFHTTNEDAKNHVDSLLKKVIDFFKPATPPVVYPSLIGSNGIFIRDEIIYRDFERLNSLYEDWYYESSFFYSSNVVAYSFRVYNYRNEIFKKSLVQHKVKQIAERALIRNFHENGLYNVHADNFIAVEIYADVLNIYIAYTDAGFSEIAQLRKSFH